MLFLNPPRRGDAWPQRRCPQIMVQFCLVNSQNAAAMFLRCGFPWEHESAVARSSADLLQQTADFQRQITRDHAGQTSLRLWGHDPGAIIGRGGH